MTAPDFAAILRTGADSVRYGIAADQIDAQLAAKVPELCQTCEGDGWVAEPAHHCHGGSCTNQCGEPIQADCDDCPTIGRLLAIGTAVMTARMESPEGSGRQGVLLGGEYLAQSADRTIAYLRAVQP